MNFDLTTTEWEEVENLTDDKIYILQAKSVNVLDYFVRYDVVDVLFAQSATEPADNKTGFVGSEFKFKKVSGVKIYIKAISTPVNIDVQEVH